MNHSDENKNSIANNYLSRFSVTESDLKNIQAYGSKVIKHVDKFIESFYTWMKATEEFELFFSNSDTLHRVQSLQKQYWQEFFQAEINDSYIMHRKHIGEAHARIGLSLAAYMASTDISLTIWTKELVPEDMPDNELVPCMRAITKLTHMDANIVVEAFSDLNSRIITEQSQSMVEMATPVTEVWDNILLLPVVGIIDSRRSQEMMNSMLMRISENQARNFILDISGVAIVDTAVANHLIKMSKATKLMGCDCTISGISPAIAQTIVELGIDTVSIRTTATLKDALEHALKSSGLTLKEIDTRDNYG